MSDTISAKELRVSYTPGAKMAASAILDRAYKKTGWHLTPLIFICYLFNYLDRINVGFANLEVLDALKLRDTVYGLGAGIFFIGYVLSGVSSNLILHKIGARRWTGRVVASPCTTISPAIFPTAQCSMSKENVDENSNCT